MSSATAQVSKTNWADDVEDQEFPSMEVITNADGTKTVIENRLNEDGKRVRVTRKIQEKIVQEHVNRAVAERKQWAKFGQLRSDGTAKSSVATTIGEVVELRLSQYAAQMKQQEIEAAEQEKAAAVKSSKILCRVCRGEHFTAKCPYKDTMTSAEDILGGGAAAPAAEEAKAGGPNAYVPPHMRAGAKAFGAGGRTAGSLGAGDARGDGRRDENPTIRITNLSEDTLEADVNQLCRPFGPLARVFVATDRSTGYCKGFAFVSYYDHESAEKAIAKLNGHGFDNLILSADWANGGK
ncbi:translation initiation factor eIF3 subunit g [Coemansia sp. RSA 2671]|nr:translation initiation factor eIF3 subunit g [Coemansia sp. RSA 2675]KAJ2015829.1 translation initiation factor eIF3 subunit g [Coemansia sp. S85]KAJ2347382.1 translation initiation factor eIF3 subunit g [Coemansia sp. RSA 2671]KAJ2411173.1 translation initiation factor eIF3 subunit g [Coemansia sp. RSA 2530]